MSTRDFARDLRKNMTDAERKLWRELRRRQLESCKFRRQAPIGKYMADFVTFERRLIVELDGGQHNERQQQDEVRMEWLESQGFKVIRFWNHDVLQDVEVVMEAIWRVLTSRPPTPTLPHKGGGSDER